jgi:hypothetical protein
MVIKEAYEKKYSTKPIVCRLKGSFSNEANEILKLIPSPNIVCI